MSKYAFVFLLLCSICLAVSFDYLLMYLSSYGSINLGMIKVFIINFLMIIIFSLNCLIIRRPLKQWYGHFCSQLIVGGEITNRVLMVICYIIMVCYIFFYS